MNRPRTGKRISKLELLIALHLHCLLTGRAGSELGRLLHDQEVVNSPCRSESHGSLLSDGESLSQQALEPYRSIKYCSESRALNKGPYVVLYPQLVASQYEYILEGT